MTSDPGLNHSVKIDSDITRDDRIRRKNKALEKL